MNCPDERHEERGCVRPLDGHRERPGAAAWREDDPQKLLEQKAQEESRGAMY